MVDVWWGITEPSPKQYDFSAYRKLFDQAWKKGELANVVPNNLDVLHVYLPWKDLEGVEKK